MSLSLSPSQTASEQPYLVTGAAGFIGSHSVDRLLAAGHRVIGVDNFRTGHRANLRAAEATSGAGRFSLIEADIADDEALARLFREYRFAGVLHLAALVSVPESIRVPALNARLNLLASDRLARQCIEHEVPRLVFASSAAVYGDAAELPNRETALPSPLSPYASAKLAVESMLAGYAASFGLSTVCLRYFNIYGPRQDPGSPYSGVLSIFSRRFLAGKPVAVHGDGGQTRDFVYVGDVAAANCRALTGPASPGCGIYNVCTGRAISLNEVLALYRERFPDAPAPVYGPAREGDVRHSLGDPGALRAALGADAVPATPFASGLAALLNASAGGQ